MAGIRIYGSYLVLLPFCMTVKVFKLRGVCIRVNEMAVTKAVNVIRN